MNVEKTPVVLGWREWLALPELGIPAIKAKIDTGAKTSTLHAFRQEIFMKGGKEHIRFWIHPLQRRTRIELVCEAPVHDQRLVKDSGGHGEQRFVIMSTARLGKREWPIEITLTSRDTMTFRMLLARSALTQGHFMVDPKASYLTGRSLRHTYKKQRYK